MQKPFNVYGLIELKSEGMSNQESFINLGAPRLKIGASLHLATANEVP
jgi:hypothetical protein